MSEYHLAQINIAAMRAPLDTPIMADFVASLAEINAHADAASGFVWRLKSDQDNATAFRVFESDRLIINMSVWESIDALFEYTYRSQHIDVYRRRADWFEKMDTPHMALWWLPAGTLPIPQDAKTRLAYMQEHGATPFAFTFKARFTPDELIAYAQTHPIAVPE
ncbi:MAG: DUF3291 domain-containing protein [Chloroflexota bacterium]|nr:DUF3291 domain-containing protein [Chloroflexota bacterium]